ncbi:MAG: metallophosphoesterase, partial [Myxococcota bacterium]
MRPRPGQATFYVAADTHFGFEGMIEANRRQAAAMNALPGTMYPAEIGGRVDPPTGIIMAGDLTESGTSRQWKEFLAHYGNGQDDGKLIAPVFECSGNHDRYGFFSNP